MTFCITYYNKIRSLTETNKRKPKSHNSTHKTTIVCSVV